MLNLHVDRETARSIHIEACRIAGFPYIPPPVLLAHMLHANKADRLLCHAVRLDPEIHAADLESLTQVVQALYRVADVKYLQIGGD